VSAGILERQEILERREIQALLDHEEKLDYLALMVTLVQGEILDLQDTQEIRDL